MSESLAEGTTIVAGIPIPSTSPVFLTIVPVILATTLGLVSLLFGRYAADRFQIPELADPSDHLAHLTVGLMALWHG